MYSSFFKLIYVIWYWYKNHRITSKELYTVVKTGLKLYLKCPEVKLQINMEHNMPSYYCIINLPVGY